MSRPLMTPMRCCCCCCCHTPTHGPRDRYTGEQVETRKEQVLLEAVWRPAPEDAFPDLPQSPRAAGTPAPAAAPAPKAGYVAPHLRGRGMTRAYVLGTHALTHYMSRRGLGSSCGLALSRSQPLRWHAFKHHSLEWLEFASFVL